MKMNQTVESHTPDAYPLDQRDRWASVIAASCVALALSACGGGGDELCGAENQSFSIDFEQTNYSANVGKNLSIKSKVFPESCHADMSFAVRTGGLPDGVALSNESVEGTPTKAGEYQVQIMISGVKGYQSSSFASFNAPRSREITIHVR